jgi:hypothetical protein
MTIEPLGMVVLVGEIKDSLTLRAGGSHSFPFVSRWYKDYTRWVAQ